jgi:hypothetical protein
MRNVKIARKKLDQVIAQIGDRHIRMPILCRYLNKAFKSLKVRFTSKQGDDYSMSGNYAGDHRDPDEGRYNVLLTYNKNEKTFKPNLIFEDNFYDDIFAVVVHEMRHGYQYRKRGGLRFEKQFKANKFNEVSDEVMYLSDSDELDAYAYEVATAQKYGHRASWVIERYKRYFKETNPKIYNRFLNKVYKYAHKD